MHAPIWLHPSGCTHVQSPWMLEINMVLGPPNRVLRGRGEALLHCLLSQRVSFGLSGLGEEVDNGARCCLSEPLPDPLSTAGIKLRVLLCVCAQRRSSQSPTPVMVITPLGRLLGCVAHSLPITCVACSLGRGSCCFCCLLHRGAQLHLLCVKGRASACPALPGHPGGCSKARRCVQGRLRSGGR